MIDPQVYRELGLSDEEFQRILSVLGREPSPTELAMFSVEWSEHCGYPRSRGMLGLFPREGKYPSRAKGEDSGGVEVAPGLFCLFKMESHNHPSQVEPKQGAATGIGGIIRDIFTMGARPIALLDSLRFGEPDNAHTRYLLGGVVDGIQFYGNCLGVPTVGGEMEFNDCYKGNCLVNVMALGLVETDKIATSAAKGKGNPVLVVGNSTGRDGIGGASILASHEFGVGEEKRPTVQIGDPFTEKCLIEACLEALATGGIVGLKDMGAAGLTCTTCEMSAAGGVGMDIELQKVPRREPGMEPWEMLMSESQERMLVVVAKGREDEIIAIFHKWDLNASIVGAVTDDGLLTIRDNGEVVAQLDAALLANPPICDLPEAKPEYLDQVQGADLSAVPEPKDLGATLLTLLASPNIASKRWAFRQYDHMVQTNTVVLPGEGDAAVLRIKGRKEGIGVTSDGNGRYCYLDPYWGAQLVVAEAARNLVCVGADPAGVTDCLNFGNPEKPDRFWQFHRGIEGIAEACRQLQVPVVSGNVSFYNEGPEGAIYPTPVIGMVGAMPDVTRHSRMGFKKPGDSIFLLGKVADDVGASEYLKVIHHQEVGRPPALDWELEKGVQQACLEMIQQGLVSSAHDTGSGGLAVTLGESCLIGGIGAEVSLPPVEGLRADAYLFGETPSQIIISCPAENNNAILELAARHNAPCRQIGQTKGEVLTLRLGDKQLSVAVTQMTEAYCGALPKLMG
jgi:phosphoribosylformylglycinamidine synthase subunit PurL